MKLRDFIDQNDQLSTRCISNDQQYGIIWKICKKIDALINIVGRVNDVVDSFQLFSLIPAWNHTKESFRSRIFNVSLSELVKFMIDISSDCWELLICEIFEILANSRALFCFFQHSVNMKLKNNKTTWCTRQTLKVTVWREKACAGSVFRH